MDRSEPSEVTRLLIAWRGGDDGARERLVPLVYTHLHDLARHYMAGERQGHPLQATALVHEAYLKLVGTPNIEWQNRGHFFAIAAQAMRRILVDFARKRERMRNAGAAQQITLDEELIGGLSPTAEVVAIDDALGDLARKDPRKAQVVELRFFGGLTAEEAAEVLNVSVDTVHRDWRLARAWLKAELKERRPG